MKKKTAEEIQKENEAYIEKLKTITVGIGAKEQKKPAPSPHSHAPNCPGCGEELEYKGSVPVFGHKPPDYSQN